MDIQAVVFAKEYWTPKKAMAWLNKNHFHPIKHVHKTKSLIRYRLQDPSMYERFRYKRLPNHVALVLGSQHGGDINTPGTDDNSGSSFLSTLGELLPIAVSFL